MKIFTDYHHGDLYFSLHLLFEQRMGWEVYRPIGLDWFHQGYWRIAEPYGNAADTINQYLAINKDGYIPYKNLNGEHYVEDEVYHIYDPGHNYYQKAITFEKFKSMKFDLIMPTYEPHELPFTQLRTLYQKRAKMLAQVGNAGQRSRLPSIIYSSPYTAVAGQRVLAYHQEIDPALFFYTPPNPNTRKLYSVVNCLPYPDIYNEYKSQLTDVEMKAYGASCPDGVLSGADGVSKAMREANISWHLKPFGGLGHSSMGWFASGRPVITNMSQHRLTGGDALALFEPGVTCLDIEAGTREFNCKAIRKMLEPEENLKWSERALHRFRDIINYEREAEQMKTFLREVVG